MASHLKHLRVVSGLTLVSRILGLARDATLAHFLGATQGLVMSAYSTAFMYPNLLRRLFGEGALSAAFIPVFTEYLERGDRKAAGRFMSLMVALLVVLLAAVTLVVEGGFLMLRYLSEGSPKWHLIFGLAAVMFPFGIAICVVALLQAALNCCRHFVMPALGPLVLNLFIIGGAVAGGLALPADPAMQAYVIAGAILAAGLVEVAIQVPALGRHGLALRPAWDLGHAGVRRVARAVGPTILAFGILQINAFVDSNIAYLLMSPGPARPAFELAGTEVAYPMALGAPAILYYGQRLYNFPLGVFGIALATVLFPVLSRQAVRKDRAGMARTASHALRLSIFVGLPAGVGLVLVAEPLLRLWLNHGRFASDPEAVPRTVLVAQLYATGIWAFCANHIFLRAFYAMKDLRTPLRLALAAAALNLALNLVLIWPLAEGGLAVATVVAAGAQTAVLAALMNRRFAELAWRPILASAARTVLATALMGAAAWAAMDWVAPALALQGRAESAARLALGLAAGLGTFAAAAWALRMSELRDLLARRGPEPTEENHPG